MNWSTRRTEISLSVNFANAGNTNWRMSRSYSSLVLGASLPSRSRSSSQTSTSFVNELSAVRSPLPAADRAAGSGDLTADSSFTKLVEVWLEDLDLEGRLAPSTRELYERDMRQLVLPAFAKFTLREISVRRVDQFIKRLAATKSYSKAKHARTVLSLAFGLAVRYDALSMEIRVVRGWILSVCRPAATK